MIFIKLIENLMKMWTTVQFYFYSRAKYYSRKGVRNKGLLKKFYSATSE